MTHMTHDDAFFFDVSSCKMLERKELAGEMTQ